MIENLRCNLIFLFICVFSYAVLADECPTPPGIPALSSDDLEFRESWNNVTFPHTVNYAVKDYYEAPYGIGYLKILSLEGSYYTWPIDMSLPLWSSPDRNKFYGWINNGQVHKAGSDTPQPLSGAGLVETEYELSNFAVWEVIGNEWLRIRVLPGQENDVWVHQCHLANGKVKFTFELWESFLEEHGDWLHFRSKVPHYLREGPDIDSARVAMIGIDHKLILLELRDDWMRVRVQQPDITCSGLSEEDFNGSTHEGWVKWKDDMKGPWVWIYTRGC